MNLSEPNTVQLRINRAVDGPVELAVKLIQKKARKRYSKEKPESDDFVLPMYAALNETIDEQEN